MHQDGYRTKDGADTDEDPGTPLQQCLSTHLSHYAGNLVVPEDILPIFGNIEWWESVMEGLRKNRGHQRSRRKNDVDRMHREFRGKLVETAGQTLMLNTFEQYKIPGNPDILSDDDERENIVRMGKGFWRFMTRYNIEFTDTNPDTVLDNNRIGEADMAVNDEHASEVCLLDFCANLRTLSDKAQAEAGSLPQIQAMTSEMRLKISKLHIIFGGGGFSEPRPLCWNGQPVPDCHWVMIPGSPVDRILDAAMAAEKENHSYAVFRHVLEHGVD